MTDITVWHKNGKVEAVEPWPTKASMAGLDKAYADSDSVGDITTDHTVTVSGGVVTDAVYSPPALSAEVVKNRLRNRLAQVANNKHRIAMLADRQERIIAGTLKAFDILTRAYKGLAANVGYNPVGDVVTQQEKQFMDAVQQRARTVGNMADVEDAIAQDIEDGTISDPDYDIGNDARWPQ